jgi:hypothetical protein
MASDPDRRRPIEIARRAANRQKAPATGRPGDHPAIMDAAFRETGGRPAEITSVPRAKRFPAVSPGIPHLSPVNGLIVSSRPDQPVRRLIFSIGTVSLR